MILLRKLLTIGEVANLLQLTTSQIRFYEKKGLLKPHHKDINGYRLYSYTEIDSLEFITTLRNTGVSIPEIKEFMDRKADYNLIDILDNTTDKIKLEIKKLTSQIDTLNNLKKHLVHNLSSSSEVIHCSERILYVIDEDMTVDRQEKDVYDFVSKYSIDYRYHEQQFLTVLIGDTQKLCLFSQDKNAGLEQLNTYTLEEGYYYTCNTEIGNYTKLKKAHAHIIEQCIKAGYTPIGEAITIEDINTLLLSKQSIHLTVQIRIKQSLDINEK
ncbi:DNA-binding transcriptional MerR regulator [Alkalibacterium olivapovliticus]|uniref:DNA-binding transcriptional MerR regulator n=1 Tax=Alkalibacterium olivapovliticus TaxID=99907 RepID=A0A2T0VV76_9LACT|nr:DNA-binding transcriptional MerR regulator [Alkalibacterium olivapovliticus]